MCGDDGIKDIMHIACCTSVISCFPGSTNQAVTQQYDRKDSKTPHHTPIFGKYPFPHLNRITISHLNTHKKEGRKFRLIKSNFDCVRGKKLILESKIIFFFYFLLPFNSF